MRKAAKAAVLFPSAMALAETFDTEHNHDRRLDLLGWYKALEDLSLIHISSFAHEMALPSCLLTD